MTSPMKVTPTGAITAGCAYTPEADMANSGIAAGNWTRRLPKTVAQMRAGVEECIIPLPITVKVRHPSYTPTGGKRPAVGAAYQHVVVQVPLCGLMRRRIIKQIIWFAVVIEISRRNQSPTRGKSWPVNTAQERYTRQIPDRGLARVEIKEREIGMAVAIEIREIDQTPARRKRLHISASDKT